MEDSRRRQLLLELSGLAGDADQHADLLQVFLPLPGHRRALDPGTLVVRGARGAGKTALFHVLRRLHERQIPVSQVFGTLLTGAWVEGFSEVGAAHPGTEVLDQWGSGVEDPALFRAFWLGHLVRRLALKKIPRCIGKVRSFTPCCRDH